MSRIQEISSHLPEHALICVVGQSDVGAFSNFSTGKGYWFKKHAEEPH